MKCYNHTDQDIVAQCQVCSRGLCSDCSEIFQSPLCQNCATEQTRLYRNSLLKQLLIFGGIFFLVFSSMASDHKSHQPLIFCFLVAYAAASVPWGWSATSRITPDVFLIMPVAGWMIYFGFKYMISGIVGFFIAPFKLYRAVRDLIEIGRQSAGSPDSAPATLKLIK